MFESTVEERYTEVAPAGGGEPEQVSFRLTSLLSGVDVEKLGFDPKRVPAAVETRIPVKALRPQMSTGRVVVPLAWVVSGLDERLRPAFAKADQDLPVELPMSEIRAQMPVAATAPVEPKPFSIPSLFAPAAEQPRPPLFTPSAEPPKPSPFAAAAAATAVKPEPQAPAWTPRPEPQAESIPSVPSVSTQASVYQQESQPIAPQRPSAPVAPSLNAGLQQSLNLVTEVTESPTQILMRAILGTSEPLTLRQILGHTSRIPGVMSSVAIQNDRVILPDMDSSDGSIRDFASHALSRYTKVKELLREFGNENFEIFTVTLGERTVSFFAAPDCTLAVLHRDAMLPAGVREKLLVIVRNLGELL